MGTSYTKLSNVIGAPFSEAVLKQLYIRAAHNSTINRSNEEVLFLANKTGWARLVSSVNITLSSDQLKNYYTTLQNCMHFRWKNFQNLCQKWGLCKASYNYKGP